MSLPVINIAPVLAGATPPAALVQAVDAAARAQGFFYLEGHGIPPGLWQQLEAAARRFFALPRPAKEAIAMPLGGHAWRGWFPLHGELTSGQPDGKEGLYLGEELGPDDWRVKAGWPLHGRNLWPADVPELQTAVAAWLDATTRAGQALLRVMAVALGQPPDWFHQHYTADPTLLFRIFRYPPGEAGFGVGEHTDYGLITLLAQDRHGGLQVRLGDGWLPVPPRPHALVVNIGDMLDRLTGGLWRSVPHRVINQSGAERLSWPLFLDPGFAARVVPLPGRAGAQDANRWDGADVHGAMGTYGDYLLGKVAKVFPDLAGGLDAFQFLDSAAEKLNGQGDGGGDMAVAPAPANG